MAEHDRDLGHGGASGLTQGPGLTEREPVDAVHHDTVPASRLDLTVEQQRLLGDLFAIVEEHDAASAPRIDRGRLLSARTFLPDAKSMRNALISVDSSEYTTSPNHDTANENALAHIAQSSMYSRVMSSL